MLSTLKSAPRMLTASVTTGSGARTSTGTCDAVQRVRVTPFTPGQVVKAESAGAGVIHGAAAPWGDPDRHLTFKVAASNITAAANVIGQTTSTAGRATAGKVVADLTISLGASGGRLQLDAIPTSDTAIGIADMLEAIVLLNGVPLIRILDNNSPAPAAGEWCLDANTDAGYTLVIGADSTDYIPVGAQIDILLPSTTYTGLLMKPGNVAGAALVANVPEERMLAFGVSSTDLMGRTVVKPVAVDFVAASVATVVLTGLSQ
jgi:hypothetical protein